MWHSTFPGQAIFVDRNIAKLGHSVSTKQLISVQLRLTFSGNIVSKFGQGLTISVTKFPYDNRIEIASLTVTL